MKILILASNPRKDLNLDREIRDLRGVIEKSRDREQFEVETALAVRVGDLQDLLLRHQPQIVHFCGHGSGAEGLVFASDDDTERWVRAEALSDLFRVCASQWAVSCVLLNACYSEAQATAIVNHIDYVIGMKQTIQDNAAIAFSKGFYRALGYACSVEQSYEFGCNAIQLEISGSSKVRSAANEVQRQLEVMEVVAKTVIPEHLKPILLKRATLTLSSPALGSNTVLAPETQVAIQLEVDKALTVEDESAEQYREQVREYLEDHKLEAYEKILLEQLREELGLSVEEADRILAAEFAPIQQAQQAYANRLKAMIAGGLYPFDERIHKELKKFQTQRNLTDEEVEAISQPLTEAVEAEAQQRLEAARQQQQERQKREQQQVLERQQQQQEKERKHKLEQQQLEQQQKREAAKRQPSLKRFEFQVPEVNIISKTIEKPGLFGKKTETATTLNIIYQQGQAECFAEDLGNGVTLDMVAIAGGTFIMGQTETEKQELIRQFGEETYQKHFARELPQHEVTLQPFLMSKFAVTQAQWRAVATLSKVKVELNPDPSNFKGAKRPVEKVAWHRAVEFCDRLSQKTGKKYRLPSEAEWEYACRSGTTTPFYCGETITSDLVNHDGNYPYGVAPKGEYRQQTTDVGIFLPNRFGLYDVHGNVSEWCADHWHENYQGAPIDGSAWLTDDENARRLLRGGSWDAYSRSCRSAFRNHDNPYNRDNDIGFRAVCSSA